MLKSNGICTKPSTDGEADLNITVRQADTADLDTVVALSAALLREDAGQYDPHVNLQWPDQYGHDYFRSMLTDSDRLVLLAEAEQEAIGLLIAYHKASSEVRPVAAVEIHWMYVSPLHRSSGVGAALAQRLIEWADGTEATMLSVSAFAANERAIAFYRSLGFEPASMSLEVEIDRVDRSTRPPGYDSKHR